MSRAQPANGDPNDVLTEVAAWLTSITGNNISSEDLSHDFELKRQGEHYALFFPLQHDGPEITAIVRRALGRWQVEDIRIPTPVETANPAGDKVKITVGDQSGQILIDNTASTASLGSAALTQLAVQVDDDQGGVIAEIGRTLISAIVRPLFDTRADFYLDTRLEDFAMDVQRQDTPPMKLRFGTSRVTLSFEGVTRDNTAKLVQGGDQGSLGQAFADFASGMAIGSRFENLAFLFDEVTGSLHSGEIVVEAEKQDGTIQGSILLDADTIEVQNTKLGPFADFVPTRLTIRPSVSHVPIDALVHLADLNRAGTSPDPADIQAMFAQGGVQTGVDSFLLDIVGSEFTGSGNLLFTSPKQFSGSGTITAANLDALQQRLAADPALAKALPVLIFIKGVGRVAGNTMVWDISYRDQRLVVNNQDMTSMLLAATGGTPPPAAKPPAPPAPQPPRPAQRRP